MEKQRIITDESGIKLESETKKRKGSTTTTLKSFKTLIKNLTELKMVNKDEEQQLIELNKKIFERWIAVEMDMTISKPTENTK